MKVHSEMFINIGRPFIIIIIIIFIDVGALGSHNLKPEAISPERLAKPNTVRTKLPLSPSWLP